MRKALRQLAVTAVEPRRHRSLRTTHHLRDLLVRQSLDVLQQDRQAKLRLQFGDRVAHCFRDLEPRVLPFLRFPVAHVTRRDRCFRRPPRQQSPAAAALVHTGVNDQPIKPGCKLRIASKLANRSEQLDEDLLRDVFGDAAIAARRVDGNGENFVSVSYEKGVKSVAVALLAGFDNLSINKLLSHYRPPLHSVPRPSLTYRRARWEVSSKNKLRTTGAGNPQSEFL